MRTAQRFPGPDAAKPRTQLAPPAPVAITTRPAGSRLLADFSRTSILPGAARDKALERYPGDERGSAPGDRLKRTTTAGALIGGGVGAVLGRALGFLVGGFPGAAIGAAAGGLVGGLVGRGNPASSC